MSNLTEQKNVNNISVDFDINTIEQLSSLSDKQFFDKIFTQKKISELSKNPNFDLSIGILLTKIIFLAGVKEPVHDLIKQDIIRMITSKFKTLTPTEIYKAFENERYGVNNPKTPHYQLFDSSYVAEIIHKYINWKQQTKTNTNYNPPKINNQKQLPQISETEQKNTEFRLVQNAVNHYIKNKNLDDIIIAPVFQILKQKNIIDQKSIADFMNSKEQQQTAYKQQQTIKKKLFGHNKIIFNQLLDDIKNKNSVAVELQMQRNFLCNFFQNNKNILEKLL